MKAFSSKFLDIDEAYLGLYPGGLGVTDNTEGNGGSNKNKVDNKSGSNNYVVFKFDTGVIFDKAFLNEVRTDSDITLFIGTIPAERPMTRQEFIDFIRTPFVFEGNDGGNQNRTADFNAGDVAGNVLIIGGKLFESNDEFLIKNLVIGCPAGQGNRAPDAVDDSASVSAESSNNLIDVLANDTDVDGDPLSITAATNGSNGTVVNNGANLSYSPNSGFRGIDTFTYTISDGNGGTDTATVTVTVVGTNVPPTANDDAATVAEDSVNNVIDVLANDTDTDGGTLAVTAVTQGANGAAVNNGTNVSYTPNANFFGTDTFTYTVSDGQGGSDTATVTVTVTPVNDAPTANDDAATVAEDSVNNVIDVLANDTDTDGGTLVITGAANGSNGTVVNNGTNLSYTPNANFFGTDAFTYTISDGQGGSDTATVTVTVTRGPATNVIINEVDADTVGTDALEFVELYDGGAGNTPLDGLVVVFFNGSNDLSYAAFDLDGLSTNANGYFTLGNTAVAGVDLVFPGNTLQNGQDAVALYIGNASNFPNNTPVTTAGVQDALVYDTADPDDPGLLVLLNAGQPQVDENGASNGDTVSMQRCPNGSGGQRNTDTYALRLPTPDGINVCTIPNSPPNAVDDSATVFEDSGSNTINVLSNDTDTNGDTLTITGVTQGTTGSVVNNGIDVSYTPAPNFFGGDTFTYTISDGNGGTDTATVTVTVTAVNDPPVAVDDAVAVDEDTLNNVISVLANDTDGGDGGPLSVVSVTQPGYGTVVNNGTDVSYTPNANFFGTDTFTYTVSDGTDTAVGTVTVTVNDVPETPSVELLVNEVEGDAPDSGFQVPCQYVELRGAPGYTVPAGTYFVSINGASGSFGDLQFIVDLGGQVVGANGTITIINDQLEGPCPNRTLPVDTTVISVFDFDGLGLAGSDSTATARTFAIITAPSAPSAGDDIDVNNDRIIDPANGITVIDGFAFTVNNAFQAAYAPVIFEALTQGAGIALPDAATRFVGDTTPLSGGAWYAGELAASPAETTSYSGNPRTANFPTGGALTPGSPNIP